MTQHTDPDSCIGTSQTTCSVDFCVTLGYLVSEPARSAASHYGPENDRYDCKLFATLDVYSLK